MPTHIQIDPYAPGTPLVPFWKKLITAGRAAEGLRDDWRQHLREVQREIGFDYIRFHGILHDDMMIYHEDAQGQPYFNWQYFDRLIDFLREVNVRPILELSFTPSALKSGESTVFWWKGNITPPNNLEKWASLIRALLVHVIDRYGLDEILKWYFEVWNEPNLYKGFWDGTQEDYFKLYGVTARTIKAVQPALKVGGPATSDAGSGEAPWIKDFLAFCEREQAPVDFISTHPYPNSWPMDTGGQLLMCYRDEDSTRHDIAWVRQAMEASPYKDLELHLTEWSSSPSPRDLVHDTAFMAPFIIQNNLRCLGLTDSLGFWTFTDVFEEGAAGDTLFHGGFGLINFLGLKKAAYYGYWYLARLGDVQLAAGNDFIVTRRGDNIQVLLWNYCHYSKAFAAGDRGALLPLNRDGIFDENPRSFALKIHGLQGSYKIVEHLLDRDHGSAYDTWLRNSALESPGAGDLAILQNQTGPSGSIKMVHCQGEYQRTLTLAPHGVLLIELQKRFTG